MHCDVAIVGGGVAGLTAAWQLASAGRSVTLFETRGRFGGRVLTVPASPRAPEVPWLDVGPAWFWPHQRHVRELVAQFGLEVFEQHTQGLATFDQGPDRAPQRFDAEGQFGPSLRLVGGMQSVVAALVRAAHEAPVPASLVGNAPVTSVRRSGDTIELTGMRDGLVRQPFVCTAHAVVLAVPPRVLARDVQFVPALPDALREAMSATVTWMGHAMKCLVTYDLPFWHRAGLSGYAVSWTGPLQEIHDASVPATTDHTASHAIMGFVAPRTSAAHDQFRRDAVPRRRDAVLAQLMRLFGPEAGAPREYVEMDWSAELSSAGPDDLRPPREHPRYGALAFDTLAWNGRLAWAGAETSRVEGGYLDGAIASGLRAARLLAAG